MNNQQRKYLVDKITERTKAKIKLLESTIPEAVSLNVHMLHKVMSNDFEIKPIEELKEMVLQKALKISQNKTYREDWLGNAWGSANKNNIAFTLDEFFVIPQEYIKLRQDREDARKKVQEEIASLHLQLETLEIRIMLASDKILQSIINEVDDMGDIQLIDTKIKLLN